MIPMIPGFRGLSLTGILVKVGLTLGLHWWYMESRGRGDEFVQALRELPRAAYSAVWLAADETRRWSGN